MDCLTACLNIGQLHFADLESLNYAVEYYASAFRAVEGRLAVLRLRKKEVLDRLQLKFRNCSH